MDKERKMVEARTIKEFRESGMLWLVNSILHMFGWCIVAAYDDDAETEVWAFLMPMRTKYRGFDPSDNEKGYYRVTKFLSEHMDELVDDCKEMKPVEKDG